MSFATNIRTQGQNWVHPSRALRRAGVVLAAAGLGLAIAFAATSGGDATRIAVTTVEPQRTFATPVQLAAATQPGVLIQAASAEVDAFSQNPRQNAALAESLASPSSAVAVDAFNQNPRQNLVLAESAVGMPSVVEADVYNQNPRQNLALAESSVGTPSVVEADVLNQNPRQNPAISGS